MAKVSELVHVTQPHTINVTRFVGATNESIDSRSLLRSLCSQIVTVYGLEALKDKVEEEALASYDVAETTGEQTLEEKLGSLDSWPPTSIEGLKAGLEIAFQLAEEDRPLVVILDGLDELSLDDDARNLDWLPRIIPENVKLIVSSAPTSRSKHQTLSILSNLYPSAASAHSRMEVPFMVGSEVAALVDRLMAQDERTLQPEQKAAFLTKCNIQKLPLFVVAAWTLFARKWTGSTTVEQIASDMEGETVPGLVEHFMERLEIRLGRYFVAKAVGYLTAARHGLARVEWEDLLSCDETVMNEVLKVCSSRSRIL
ncbi:hypothetical protein BC830DRAFT_337975 [Chytriomyces sp. MP71]|nr:hypothetical protein BC830DRAFT_337975 [Chytriomyces sp. MP71]